MAASAFTRMLLLLLLSSSLLAIAGRVLQEPQQSQEVGAEVEEVLEGEDLEDEIFDESLVPEHRNSTSLRRELGGSCKTGNPIDDCWRCNNWRKHRKQLAHCAIGYGSKTRGGSRGKYYVVTDSSDDSPANPKYGTLRWGVTRNAPLWIVFARDMTIKLSIELIVNSYKTIDGRGVHVQVAGGACFTIQDVKHVIIESISIYNCKSAGPGVVMSNENHVGHRQTSDGDGVSIFTGTNIWVDHCYVSSCADGLIDAIHTSSYISITNNHFENHDKVMLLGHNDDYSADKAMRVTVAYNKFGSGLGQRMPRVRFGVVQVLNNDYTSGWAVYAVGGSADPTIYSEGNIYAAGSVKEVTKRDASGGWSSWVWSSTGDEFRNGAYFVESGGSRSTAAVTGASALPAARVPAITAYAGPF